MTRKTFEITDKVAVITGGAGLLGKEFARTLLEYGGRVVLVDISRTNGDAAVAEVRREVPGDIWYQYADITSKESVERMVGAVVGRYGRVDILVNNAAVDPKFDAGDGCKHEHAFEDYPLELWEQAIAVNLTGAFLCCQAVGRVMGSAGGGVIVNIASELGLIAPDQRIYIKRSDPDRRAYKPADYPVTKAGLIHLTRYLASYWGGRNIRVNSLCPAAVQTNQDRELVENISFRTMLGRMSHKSEFCGALIFLVSDASSYMTGANLVVDGGRSAW